MSLTLFKSHTIDEHANSLAAYLPTGRATRAAYAKGSNTRNLLKGLSGELKRVEQELRTYVKEYDIRDSELLLGEWERAVGIPDSCFSGTGTIQERQRDVLVKLAASGVQTAGDFEALAEIFGVTVEVTAGIDQITFPLVFPVAMFTTEQEARFTIVVTFTDETPNIFPMTFPFVFGSDVIALIECIFKKLKPANCQIFFQQG